MKEMTRPWLKSYDKEVSHTIDYEAIPVFGYLDRAAKRFPKRKAIVFQNWSITYKKLHHLTEVMAANLRALGVQPGERISIMLPNLPQTIISYWAALKAGATVVMTNPLYMEKELIHQLNDADCQTMIVLDHLWPKVEEVRDKLPVKKFLVVRIPDCLSFPLNLLYGFNARKKGLFTGVPFDGKTVIPWKPLMKGEERISRPPADPREDIALLQYTGGTTGVSKGVMITHQNMTANVQQCRTILHALGESHETFVAVMPFFHIYGLTTCLNLPTSIGATMVPVPRFDPQELLTTLHKRKISIFPGAPAIYSALLLQKNVKPSDFDSVRYCVSGSAAIPVEVLEQFKKMTSAEIIEGYGLTEASPVTHLNPLSGVKKYGSIGLPFPSTDARIVDMEVGELNLAPGKRGELVIRGPQVMKGYWNRPDETANAVRNGWLYTGDIAMMDEDGYFFIVDRKKDLIITSGYNVYPREIDEVLYEHPKIKDAVAVGIPHPSRGEIIKVYVVLKDGESMTKSEVISWCRQKLAKYKLPRKVEFRPELPKTMVGKVLRRALRAEEEKKMQRMAERHAARQAAKARAGAAGDDDSSPEADLETEPRD
ncbi:long-chain acyl-CoA synthetase [Desulfobaculum xiamenense]|uniref:Long-chain acyl-CoA synthetase n=1 Tax=Desulfobaculum xiamenense TaxID=995050 RepID=A0A846QKC5_9BACT|nr:long-chain fatty acid--CoA ligase [Desulfobaculum xiamenense]NJB69376.1 long-chain acyl-CoA synthetase [Desulfobaculum xiamenense]